MGVIDSENYKLYLEVKFDKLSGLIASNFEKTGIILEVVNDHIAIIKEKVTDVDARVDDLERTGIKVKTEYDTRAATCPQLPRIESVEKRQVPLSWLLDNPRTAFAILVFIVGFILFTYYKIPAKQIEKHTQIELENEQKRTEILLMKIDSLIKVINK